MNFAYRFSNTKGSFEFYVNFTWRHAFACHPDNPWATDGLFRQA
jgi:hypothetical protein